jgi:hypothetical protein
VRSVWLKASTPADSIVMSEQPQTDYLYSGRKTVPYPNLPISVDALNAHLARYGVDYILVAPRLKWLPNYDPEYSEKTVQLLTVLGVTPLAPSVSEVYASEYDAVRVFAVRR